MKVLNEEENSILHILYCYSLQQHIFLAFCNNSDAHYRLFAYILLRNKILLFSKWGQKPTRPILRYSSVVNMEKGKFTNFKNSYKINKNSFNDNCFAVVIRGKIYTSEKKNLGVSGTLMRLKLVPPTKSLKKTINFLLTLPLVLLLSYKLMIVSISVVKVLMVA